MPGMTVKTATQDLLRAVDMTTVFGNPGSTEIGFLQDWPDDFRYVLGLQESAVVGMADGYAQARNHAAFVSLHSAGGVGHAMGGIFTAVRNQTPLVITAGQQSRSLMAHRPFLGASSATEFPKPYVKWSCEPARAEDVPLAIAQAYTIAMQRPCGPTFVSIPADDWSHPAAPVVAPEKSRNITADPTKLGEVIEAVDRSVRPAIVAGPAIGRENMLGEMIDLAEHINAPVWSAPIASRKNFDEGHRLYQGHLPAVPELLAEILGGYDLVLVLGAPAFTIHVPGNISILDSVGPIYQITDDPDAVAISPSVKSILASMGGVLPALRKGVRPNEKRAQPPLRKAIAPAEETSPLSAEYVLQTVSELAPADSIFLEESPSYKDALQMYLPASGNKDFFAMASGGLGFGVPAAAGIAMARPDKRVIAFIGDGSSMYSFQAIWTAGQHRLPVTYIILNNQGYGAMRAFGRIMQAADVPGTDLPGLDFAALAKGMDCAAVRVEHAEDLKSVLTNSFDREGPFLIEVAVDAAIPDLYGIGE